MYYPMVKNIIFTSAGSLILIIPKASHEILIQFLKEHKSPDPSQ